MRRPLAMLALSVALVTAAGCGLVQGEPCGSIVLACIPPLPTSTPSPARDWPVPGQEFVATSITEDGAPRELAPGTELSIVFHEPYELSVDAGCNQLRVMAHIEESHIVADSFAATAIGCPDDLLRQDAWVVAFFEDNPAMVLAGDDLVLHTDRADIELTRP